MYFSIKATLIALFCLIGIFVFALPVFADDPAPTIRDANHSVKYVSQTIPDPIILAPGEEKTVTIKFRNTGTETLRSWNDHRDGKRHVSAYTMEPRDRVSLFRGNNWISGKQTASIKKDTPPGGIAELEIALKAPNKPGEYREEFYLAAENWTWIDNGYFYLDLRVTDIQSADDGSGTPVQMGHAPSLPGAPNTSDVDLKSTTTTLSARIITQNKKKVTLKGGEKTTFVAVYRNTGADWENHTLHATHPTALASATRLTFADVQWSGNGLVRQLDGTVAHNAIHREKFQFRAPVTAGEYTATFFLAVDGKEVDGSQVSVNVHVTENAPHNYTPPAFSDDVMIVPKEPRLKEEPRVRVGLTTDGNTVQVVSYDDDYRIFNGTKEMGILPKKKIAIITFKGGVYHFKGGEESFRTNNHIRLEPINNQHAVFTVIKGLKDRRVAWVGPSKFLRYRGAFEYRRGEVDEQLYVVNDLLMEDYVEGISETGKGVAIEAVKANLVAARTYAFISKNKYPFFDVLGSTYDQLYLGHDVAENLVDVGPAAKATRGQMVTYKNEVVTTPYFGNSNGKTRSWSSVWGGTSKPWLVPVVARYDAGRRQFGHGVGMSQRDAQNRAKKDGWTSDQLLKHYYTGIDIETMYK